MSKATDTRLMILNKSFELIYRKGYQATSIDDIISTTQVTKGAFFYHFKNKEEMGLGLINELLYPSMSKLMVARPEKNTDPIGSIYNMMEKLLMDEHFFDVDYGCPAINLIEEMAPINKSFKQALSKLVQLLKKSIVTTLESARLSGQISAGVSPEEAALVILSGYGGVRNLGKVLGRSSYVTYLKGLKDYLSKL
jgi:TetR/AcrR family transcriptional repressor of nem operon